LPPTTTTVPGTGAVTATCATLQTASWPDRRAVILVNTAAYQAEGGAGALADAVRVTCPDDLARQEAAVELEQRTAAAAAAILADPVDVFTATDCPEDVVSTTWTNHTDQPIGLVGGARGYQDGVDLYEDPMDSAFVVWAMTPAQALLLTMPFVPSDGGCGFVVGYFVSDPGPADAFLPHGPGPATTGDDPATWLPALLQADLVAAAGPTETALGDVEDTRILREPVDEQDPVTDVHPLVAAVVCAGTIDQPDTDHIAFASRAEYGPATIDGAEHGGYATLSYNAFRRGSDGRWRRLREPLPLTGAITAADCGPVVAHG
jgi:hypothetical protein